MRGNFNITHGANRRRQRTPEYNVWASMRRRCKAKSGSDHENYVKRGIKVCERWDEFAAFLEDMGPRPTSKHTIERTNNNAGYSPDNCVWATRDVQAKNRRTRARLTSCARGHLMDSDNVYVRANGKRGCRKCRQMNMRDYYSRQKVGASDGAR